MSGPAASLSCRRPGRRSSGLRARRSSGRLPWPCWETSPRWPRPRFDVQVQLLVQVLDGVQVVAEGAVAAAAAADQGHLEDPLGPLGLDGSRRCGGRTARRPPVVCRKPRRDWGWDTLSEWDGLIVILLGVQGVSRGGRRREAGRRAGCATSARRTGTLRNQGSRYAERMQESTFRQEEFLPECSGTDEDGRFPYQGSVASSSACGASPSHEPRQTRSPAVHASAIGFRPDDPFKRAYPRTSLSVPSRSGNMAGRIPVRAVRFRRAPGLAFAGVRSCRARTSGRPLSSRASCWRRSIDSSR